MQIKMHLKGSGRRGTELGIKGRGNDSCGADAFGAPALHLWTSSITLTAVFRVFSSELALHIRWPTVCMRVPLSNVTQLEM